MHLCLGYFGSGRGRLPWGSAALSAGLVWMLLGGGPVAAQSGASTPPPAVEVAAVVSKPVDRAKRFIGTVQAIESVQLKARVEGFLEQVAFAQGAMVDQGQLLYQIEQAPYQADLASAEGQLAAAQADLDAAKAALEDKQADFERQSVLVKKGDTSRTAFDKSKADRDEARANVEKAQASVQQGQASVATARINLGYTTVASPIAGRIGATAVTVGNLVDSASGTLATVVQLDPIRAVFSIPSAERVRLLATAGGNEDAARERFVPRLLLPTGEEYAHEGKIAFSDNQVDAATGTVAIYADFPNPDQLLLPGQFISAVVHQAEAKRLPTIPSAAVQRTRDGAQVYVVGADNRVTLRKIADTTSVGNEVAVGNGLRDGEIVVVSGLQKIKPGMVVSTQRSPKPNAQADDAAPADTGDAPMKTPADAKPAGATDAGSEPATSPVDAEAEPDTETDTKADTEAKAKDGTDQ